MAQLRACPACLSPRLVLYPRSRATGLLDFRCAECGVVGWADRGSTAFDPIGLDTISVEQQQAWVGLKRAGQAHAAWGEVLQQISGRLSGRPGSPECSIYDVGAGDGAFLAEARSRGFRVGGNEIVEAAALLAKQSHDIDLDLGDLTTLGIHEAYDAVTLWCVLAHVANTDETLASCRDLLRPGGVMYLQTPHRSLLDRAALNALRASGGRVSKWVDRRIAAHHWVLHSTRSMERTLSRLGFVDIEVRPMARYSLTSTAYLQWAGVRGRAATITGRTLDALIDRGLAPRIVLDVYARRAW